MYPPYNLSRPTPVPDRRWMPNVELAPNCPRCDSSNTKFCYYNNYSLTQPRYFCKGCRRYWTKGGSLRNVPVGGGCRKNRRSKSVRLSAAASRQRTSAAGNDHQELDGVAAPSAAATGSSSNIDLAVLYSKFLSQGEQAEAHDQTTEPELVADQITFDLVGSSSGSDQLGLTGEFDYCFDPAGYESMGIDPAAVDGDVYSANSASQVMFQGVAWQPPEFSDVVGMSHHYNHYSHHHPEILGGDWCSSMDQSSFGAF